MSRRLSLIPVVVLVVACGSPSAPTTAPSPATAPSPVAAATSFQDVAEGTDLDAGSYVLQLSDIVGGTSVPDADISFTVPDGWSRVSADGVVWHDDGARIKFGVVDNLYVDPCDPDRGLRQPAVGPSVADLSSALSTVPGWGVTETTPVSISGFEGTAVVMQGPADLSSCWEESSLLGHALGKPDYIGAISPDERHQVRILDVGGTRLVIDAIERTDVTPTARADMESIVRSIAIER